MAKETKKYIIPLLGIVVVGLIIGAFYFGAKQLDQSKANAPIEYLSFAGNCKFTLPADYVADGESIPGAVLISKTGANSKIKEITELYDQGGITVHLLSIVFAGNSNAFEKYINGDFKSQLAKALKGEVEIVFDKKGKDKVAVVKVVKGGETIRFEKIINFLSAPVVLAAKDDSDEFKQIFTTLTETGAADQAKKIKSKVTSCVTFAQNGLYEDIYDMFTAEAKENGNKKDFVDSFAKVKDNLKRNFYVAGGTLKGNIFLARLRLNDPTGKTGPSFGLISMEKTSNGWELTGFKIPGDESEKKIEE